MATLCSLPKQHLNIVLHDHKSSAHNVPALADLQTCLLGTLDNLPSEPAAKYTRAIYHLRTLGTTSAVNILCRALVMKTHTPLIRHEIGYVLGQMQQQLACKTLEDVLSDAEDDVMVRHECAEALGAIGDERSLPLLERMANTQQQQQQNQQQQQRAEHVDNTDTKVSTTPHTPDNSIPEELRETCEIARDFCRWKAQGETGDRPQVACACMLSPYNSYDPAPPSPETDGLSTAELGDALLNDTLQLFERYRAMFALRNRGGEACVIQLGRALVNDESSALLRHEVAYVLGQMAHPAAIDPLAESLRRVAEHSMVRHESAEALGAIEGDEKETIKCHDLLKEFSNPMHEKDSVVRESCEVALDTMDYWNNFT
jgi:deoxyhypusine monooxygenase